MVRAHSFIQSAQAPKLVHFSTKHNCLNPFAKPFYFDFSPWKMKTKEIIKEWYGKKRWMILDYDICDGSQNSLLFAIGWAHKETFVSRQQKGKEHIQWWAAKRKELRKTNCRNKTALFYLPFMRHSHYLNVCHIRRDLLNSIYYNVMLGLNGKSMTRQARHCWDHTKAISKLTYGGPMWLILTAVGFSYRSLRAHWLSDIVLWFICKLPNESLSPFSSPSSFPSTSFFTPLFSEKQGEWICWIRYVR